MAKKRSKRTKRSAKRSSSCKVVTVCGKRRRLCFGKNGKIRTNTAVGGGKGGRVAKRSSSACLKANGRLKKGCKFKRGGGAVRVGKR